MLMLMLSGNAHCLVTADGTILAATPMPLLSLTTRHGFLRITPNTLYTHPHPCCSAPPP